MASSCEYKPGSTITTDRGSFNVKSITHFTKAGSGTAPAGTCELAWKLSKKDYYGVQIRIKSYGCNGVCGRGVDATLEKENSSPDQPTPHNG